MEIIKAHDIAPMPYGLLSVVDVKNTERESTIGFEYQVACGHGTGWAADQCVGTSVTSPGGVAPFTVTLDTGTEDDVTIDWGDGSTETGSGEVTHNYAAAGEVTVTVTGADTSYGVRTYTFDPSVEGAGALGYPAKEDTASLESVTSVHFLGMAQSQCNRIGRDPQADDAVAVMNRGESHMLEQAFVSLFPAVDLTTGTAVTPKQGLALLMQHAAVSAPERPIIHMNAGLVHLVGDIERHGNHLETVAGAYVSAGTGYSTDAWDTTTPARIYVSGQVNGFRGTMQQHEIFTPESNQLLTLAERHYSLDSGCVPPAFVEVTL